MDNNDNDIAVTTANLNIGYLYSNGLGCNVNLDKAGQYYLKATELGLKDEGLDNYISLNLTKPTSLELVMEALRKGFYAKDENTIQYLSYLQTGTMYAKIEDSCYENAELFIQKIEENQQLNLEGNLVIGSVEIQKINGEYNPQDTIFRKYEKYANRIEAFEDGTTSKLILENGEYKEVLEKVYNFDNFMYYIVTNYKFKFSDNIFSEKFYENINT